MNFPVTGEASGTWEADGSCAELVCCGHPPPLLLRDGSAVFVEPYAAPPLGLLDLADGWCRASMIPVGHGDQLLLYTDGVSEARDAAGRFFPLAQVTAEAVGQARAFGDVGAAGPSGPLGPTGRGCSMRSSPAWMITSVTDDPTTSSCCS